MSEPEKKLICLMPKFLYLRHKPNIFFFTERKLSKGKGEWRIEQKRLVEFLDCSDNGDKE